MTLCRSFTKDWRNKTSYSTNKNGVWGKLYPNQPTSTTQDALGIKVLLVGEKPDDLRGKVQVKSSAR
jgi:hypothetical protein